MAAARLLPELAIRIVSVPCMVGSTDYFGDARFGQINGATIRRSPGSALKPFLYAMSRVLSAWRCHSSWA